MEPENEESEDLSRTAYVVYAEVKMRVLAGDVLDAENFSHRVLEIMLQEGDRSLDEAIQLQVEEFAEDNNIDDPWDDTSSYGVVPAVPYIDEIEVSYTEATYEDERDEG